MEETRVARLWAAASWTPSAPTCFPSGAYGATCERTSTFRCVQKFTVQGRKIRASMREGVVIWASEGTGEFGEFRSGTINFESFDIYYLETVTETHQDHRVKTFCESSQSHLVFTEQRANAPAHPGAWERLGWSGNVYGHVREGGVRGAEEWSDTSGESGKSGSWTICSSVSISKLGNGQKLSNITE